MKLEEAPQPFELKNSLSCLRLPGNPKENSPDNKDKSSKKDILEIKSLLKDMKLNEHRTTNFATILYIEDNSFEKTSMEEIKLKLRKEYNVNKSMFVNSKNNKPFETEGNLIRSMNASISRNKAFTTQMINNQKYVSLNEPQALAYLKKMYKKYTINFNGDITSMASVDSKRSKFGLGDDSFTDLMNKSERKKKSNNLIGNKHLRSSSSKDEEIITEEQKRNIKILKENLRAKKPNNAKKEKKEKITDFFQQKEQTHEEKKATPTNNEILYQDIDELMNTLDKNIKVVSSYKTKMNQLTSNIHAKDKLSQDYENEMVNIYIRERKLNLIYEAMKLKLCNIQSTKKHIYYGDFFEKSKKISSIYKAIFDKNIDIIKKNWNAISSIRAQIKNKNKDIADEIKKISEIDNGISYPGKNEYKKDLIGGLMKKIKSNLRSEEYEDTDSNARVNEAIKKFNDVANRMTQEKEDFD